MQIYAVKGIRSENGGFHIKRPELLTQLRRVFLTMTRFSIYKRCILDHTLFNFETFQVKLSLKLLSNQCINARFGHALPK